jgi:hypothetical protein
MNRRNMLQSTATAVAALVCGAQAAHAQEPGGELDTFWTHGTGFQIEDLNQLTGTQRVGWGTLFEGKSGAFTWVHIPIPTPAMLDDRHTSLEKVYVLYKVNGARIRNVHIYDGARKIKAFDNLQLSANEDRGAGVVPANTWVISPPEPVTFSIGISLGVQFSTTIDYGRGAMEILLVAAGADFRSKTVPVNTNLKQPNKFQKR